MPATPIPRRGPQNAFTKRLAKISEFSLLDAFNSNRKNPYPREVLVGVPVPPEASTTGPKIPLWTKKIKDGEGRVIRTEKRGLGSKEVPAPGWTFSSNQVLTSKYNIVTFLPRNLLEQFRRVANIFFLVLVILQFFPRFTTVNPGLSALPLIAVLFITALKDGYEDLKRHQSDRAINNIRVLTLGGSYRNHNLTLEKSKSLGAPLPEHHRREAGDFYDDEADDVEAHGGPTDVPGHPNAEQQPGGHVHIPIPHLHGHGGHGKHDRPTWVKETWEDLRVGDFVRLHGDESVPADIIVCATSEEENVCYVETKNLDGETNLKSRSAVPELTHLRTSSAIANEARFILRAEPPDVNMFTYNAAVELHDGRLGKDGGPLKCPVNLSTMLLRGTVVRNTEWVVGVVCMTGRDTKIVMNSGATPSKRSKVERQMNPMVFINLFLLALMTIMCALADHYIQVEKTPEGAYWLYGNDRGDDNPNINGVITWANALIAFQNIVPISLYISIEFTRLVQAAYIWGDDDIKGNGRRTTARSWNLSDDLGQIEYIFSDKTGTLTQNAMFFRQCSVAGKVYIGDEQAGATDTTVVPEKPVSSNSSSEGEDSAKASPGGAASDGGDGKAKTKLADQVVQPFHDSVIDGDLAKRDSTQARHLYNFFMNLALCHTVLTSEEDGLISYKAQSPDEAALVQAAADVGFVFLGRDKDVLRVQTPHDPDVVEFELLNVLEFTSARKRMSVVLRKLSEGEGQGSLMLLTKGADNVIFERLSDRNADLKKQTDKHLEDFANEGLRTLCLAWKPLDEAGYDTWERQFHEATTLIEHRDEEMERLSDELERGLDLLGATAIEDRLQDGVPEAIADLKRAGIKIWVATGDKLETAIAIAKTCNLLSRDMNLIVVKGGGYGEPNSAYSQLRSALERFFDAEGLAEQLEHQPPDAPQRPHGLRRSSSFRRSQQLRRTQSGVSGMSDIVGHDNGERPGGYGLVIDGSSLRHAFDELYTKELLLELATRCRAVVCCRTSPLQKALIVRLVKDGLGSMCLAIGDGANDVSMIQAADIGVGVAGEEGLQAVNSSDYAMGQFRFLKRLLLVHGTWSYYRNSTMIVNFFYKEIIGIGVLFFFQFYCGYSATTVYEYTYLLFWNVFWTLVPVIFIGIFDRHVGERALMAVPELYEAGRRGKLFGIVRFAIYMLDGVYQSAVIYFFLVYAYDTTAARDDGYDVNMYEFSTVMAVAAVLAANFYNGLNTYAWNWWVLGGVLIGPVLIVLYTAIYAAFPPSLIWTYVWGNNTYLWPSAYWWLGLAFTILLSLGPRYLFRYLRENYFPRDVDILRIIEARNPHHDFVHDPAMPHHEVKDGAAFGPVSSSLADGGGSESATAASPIMPRRSVSRRTGSGIRDSYQLAQVRTGQSLTHDMATGSVRSGVGSGYVFDEGVPLDLQRYTTRGSERSFGGAAGGRQQGTPRRTGSIGAKLNPFARSPGGTTRDRSASFGARLFRHGGRKSTVHEHGKGPGPAGDDADVAETHVLGEEDDDDDPFAGEPVALQGAPRGAGVAQLPILGAGIGADEGEPILGAREERAVTPMSSKAPSVGKAL
ncbi:uncharacterized protein RHOBADRAFT_35702 [Rhodotorula graminis WP1]|uniref:Phospholipid-transporting ATPase n=1 Tax=Rhodotorula graminis (strain WP1) TaxID=578459 RepID=A0A194S5S5_RHOGW|nr:uncharacterized protein RHOBADRAFT_35702 [Rhodotorula graminis WP1]KPV75937.1 hypothetical protein RHOBADRAFT_35702 [Rhodotorula graminis WP1]